MDGCLQESDSAVHQSNPSLDTYLESENASCTIICKNIHYNLTTFARMNNREVSLKDGLDTRFKSGYTAEIGDEAISKEGELNHKGELGGERELSDKGESDDPIISRRCRFLNFR